MMTLLPETVLHSLGDFQSHHVCSRTAPCSPKLRLFSKLAVQEDVDISFYKVFQSEILTGG